MHLATFHLKGWKQIAAALVLIVAAAVGYSFSMQSGLAEQLPTIVEKRLKTDLEMEIAHRTLPIDQGTTPTREQGDRYLKERESIDDLQVLSVEKRGFGRSVVARVCYTLGNEQEHTRYYRIRYNWLTKWHVWSSVTPQAWQTAWL